MNFLLCLLAAVLVQTQKDFDMLQTHIDNAYEAGNSRIDIKLDSTVFFFHENHLSFVNRTMPGFSINFDSKGAVVVGESTESAYRLGQGFVDLETLSDFDASDDVKWAWFWPLKVPFRKGVFCIPVKEPDMSEEEAKDIHIVLSQWFLGKIYKVLKISNGWLYFRRDDRSGTRMHTELRFGRCLPRYIICRPPERDDLHVCSASNFLTVEESELGEVSFRGIRFLGNSDSDALMRFASSKIDSVVVEKCIFEGIRSDVIVFSDAGNLRYRDSFMDRCYRSGIHCDEKSDNCHVTGSTFTRCGWMMVHNFNVQIQGSGFLIKDNVFEDFSYSGIGVGSHYTSEFERAEGIICNNELSTTEEFQKGAPRMLIDAGAIYTATRNKNVVICHNYVHDIHGPHGNRGIFADDGAINLTICNNRVMNLSAQCISLRRVKRITWRPKSKIKKVNVGNKVYDNIANGRIRVYVDPRDTSSYAYNNVRIKKVR